MKIGKGILKITLKTRNGNQSLSVVSITKKKKSIIMELVDDDCPENTITAIVEAKK